MNDTIRQNPADMPEMMPGSHIALLCADFDPPTFDARRFAAALLLRPDIKGVWACPLGKSRHVYAMSQIFCSEFGQSEGRITCCTSGVDMAMAAPVDVLKWARDKFPAFRFSAAGVCLEIPGERTYYGRFAQHPYPKKDKAVQISMDKHLSVQDGVRDRIRAGSDESRNIYPAVWGYIQKHRLYRE